MQTILEYQVREKLTEKNNVATYRALDAIGKKEVTVTVLKINDPTASEIARFKQEYERIKNFNSNEIIRVIDVAEYNNGFAIIQENFNGMSLSEELGKSKKMDVKRFLNIAISLTQTITKLHQHNIIHRNLTPHSILVHPETGKVKITDFGISKDLTREYFDIHDPLVIKESLFYISPEQTGRMNRTLDYRTDFYSLGITFYEMLTGSPPFNSEDPMEIIHSHIAKKPSALNLKDPSIPDVLSDIIQMLLLKTPEERYQNGFGLLADLNECQARLTKNNRIEKFKIARKDIYTKFLIPQVLYGRDIEVDELLKIFDRVTHGSTELMVVAGMSGVGKSALIHEIYKPTISKRGYYTFGKFEEFRRDTPYNAIIQSFIKIIEQVLTEDNRRIQKLKTDLENALGPSKKFMVDLLPKLSLVVGSQENKSDMQGTETKSLVYQAFKNFITVFAKEDHPLVMFLDDLQWVDTASLALIRRLMIDKDVPYFFLILTYRDNEVDISHPLSVTLTKIKKAGVKVNRLAVNALNVDNVNQLISNLLRTDVKATYPLSELVHKKTNGNPFFIIQFLKSLYNEKIIIQNPEAGWQWDMDVIKEMQVTENVVHFMLEKIKVLPVESQEILKICATIGNRFDLETLAVILNLSVDQTLEKLTRVIDEGLVSLSGESYRFHHDRIQEAAYSLLSDHEKILMHYKIGNFLLKNTEENVLDEKILYITSHLNSGRKLLRTREEEYKLAGLNLRAARKASASGGFDTALTYINKGIALLPKESWDEQYKLTLKLFNEAAVSAYRSYKNDEMENAIKEVISHAKDVLHTEKVYEIKILSNSNQNNYDGAIKAGLEVLATLGIHLPEKPEEQQLSDEYAEIKNALTEERIKSLYKLPKMKDLHKMMAMRVLTRLIFPFMSSSHDLAALAAFERFRLTIRYGRTYDMDIANASLASILCAVFDDIETGDMLIKETMVHCNSLKSKLPVSFFYHALIQFRKNNLRDTLLPLYDIYGKSIREFGDVQTAGLALTFCGGAIYAGLPLADLEKDFSSKTIMATRMLFPFGVYIFQLYRQQIRNLMGLSDHPARISGDILNSEQYLPLLKEANAHNLISITYMHEAFAAFMFEDYLYALEKTDKALDLMHMSYSAKEAHTYTFATFYDSIIRLAAYPEMASMQKKISFGKIQENLEKLKLWAKYAPMNFQHKVDLVEAGLAALKDDNNAIDLYDQSIKNAVENEYVNEAAIACELAAKFFLKQKKNRFAKMYMEDALKYYTIWGANRKIKDLENRYPQITSDIMDRNIRDEKENLPASEQKKPLINLDVSSIVKTSQALASEIHLGTLLKNILKFAIENAGAYSGFLILENDKDRNLYIEAKGNVDNVEITCSIPVEGSDLLSSSIVNYVHKTRESVVINNAQKDIKFAKDSYIIQNESKSVLCAPMIHHGKMSGILYLENHLATGAFTNERLEPLKIFSTQVAISIENARLLSEREKNAKLETEMYIAANIQTALLVNEPVIYGFEITTFMKPADDVGGDYYDVINTKINDWIIIGDVSGHGVSAGLIMMMTQTSLHTAILSFPDMKPSGILKKVNQVISQNINRLGEEKYMTLTAMVSDRKGTFSFAGLHLDILVYRKKTDRVESIPSNGIWIGITEDITGMLKDETLALERGDIMLLHTDGVTEAVEDVLQEKSSKIKMFGTDKLENILSEQKDQPTENIKNSILDALAGYHVKDDVTLVILKKE